MSQAHSITPQPEALAELERYGSTVIRQAWDLDHLAELRAAIETFIAARAQRLSAGSAAPRERLLHVHGAATFSHMVIEGVVSNELLPRMFAASRYRDLCVAHLGDDTLYVQPPRMLFRYHDPMQDHRSFVPYHQDSGTQDARIGQVLNCWIPLTPGAGTVAPGLEVVRTPSEPGFPLKDFGLTSENAIYDPLTIDRARIVETYGEDLFYAPAFEVGDGFVFTQDVIHRTYVTPEMTEPRVNFEFRVFSPRHIAPDADHAEVLAGAVRVS